MCGDCRIRVAVACQTEIAGWQCVYLSSSGRSEEKEEDEEEVWMCEQLETE